MAARKPSLGFYLAMASRLMPFLLLLVFISSLVFLTGPKSSEKCRMQDPSKGPRQFKHSRIVQADAAGQGNPDRLQCTDGATKTRVSSSGSSCFKKGTKNVAFVSLFVPPGPARDNPCDESVVGGRVLRAFDKPFAVLDVFVESVRLAMPYSEQIIVTDPNAWFPNGKLPEGVTIERFSGNYSRGNLMLQRLESYVAFLELKLQEQVGIIKHLIFTDSDIIIVRDLGCVFVENPGFDVGVTFRNNKEQPINSGVIFVRGTNESLMKGKLFMQEVLNSYKKNFMRAARMMGDQLAFAQVVRTFSDSVNQQFRQGKVFEANVKSVNVLFLPCSLYNWTPAEGAGQFHGMPLEVKVIHFKGSRKRLMIEAWHLHKQRAAPDEDIVEMKCFVLRSGRAKYDF